MAQLLSYPSVVEAPFIYVEIGGKKFGTPDAQSKYSVDFPNYMSSISIEKVSGKLNSYTIQMIYKISTGDDPNYLDTVFASVGIGGKIKIGYGDCGSSDFTYKDEEAILLKITTDVDFSGSQINYTLEAQSSAIALTTTTKLFAAKTAKPSDELKAMIKDKSTGLQDVFPTMSTGIGTVNNNLNRYIASDDKVTKLDAMECDTWTRMCYLVDSMESVADSGSDIVNNSAYFLTIDDSGSSTSSSLKSSSGNATSSGMKFRVTKVTADTETTKSTVASNSISTSSSYTSGVAYDIDVGYPENDFVLAFSIDNDQTYNYILDCAISTKATNYVYKIDNNGHLQTVYSPNLTTSSTKKITTSEIKSWWTKATKLTYNASLTIKGLVKPTILMEKVRLNVYFFGQKHTSSGIYVITKQVDTVDDSGYRTVLSLTKIDGD